MLKNFERATRDKQTFLSKLFYKFTEKTIDKALDKLPVDQKESLQKIRGSLKEFSAELSSANPPYNKKQGSKEILK